MEPIAKAFGGKKAEPAPAPPSRDSAAEAVKKQEDADRIRRAAASNVATGPQGVADEATGKKLLGAG